MAFTPTTLGSGRAYSIGPIKQQTIAFTTASGDTTATFSAPNFILVEEVLVEGGMVLAAAPSITNTSTPPSITLTFAASPTAGNFGTITIRGK